MIWIVGTTALVAGLLVGLTGIGGVLLVPVLTGAAGVPLERAVAACMPAFLCSGLYAAHIHLPRAGPPARGAATLDLLPETGVRLFVVAVAWTLIGVGLWFGLNSLAPR